MQKSKWNVYVAILDRENHLSYVTSENSEKRVAYWEKEKQAMKMTSTGAKSLVECLRANGYRAILVELPDYVTPRNY